MLKFIAESVHRANRLSKGDALDKSVEGAVAACPIGKVILIEPRPDGWYLIQRGTTEAMKAKKDTPVVHTAPSCSPPVMKKKEPTLVEPAKVPVKKPAKAKAKKKGRK